MRTIQSMLLGALFTTVAASGCAGGDPSTEAPIGQSQARVVVAAQGNGSATVNVTAIDEATANVVFDETIHVDGGSAAVFELDLAASSYLFHADAFADAEQTIPLGSGSAEADLEAGLATEITLTTQVDGDASAEAFGATSEGTIAIDVSAAGSADASASGDVDASVDAGASADACLEANADCTAACAAALSASPLALAANASCVLECSASLASCSAD